MLGYLKRLVVTGAAYQFGDILAKGLALLTLPLYTRHVSPEGYGAAETLLTAVILVSILLRGGVGEAFIRFYFDDADEQRRDRIARTATATVAWTTTVASLVALAFAAPALEGAARLSRPAADRLRDPRPVGLHEPGNGLRPAAGRRTPSHLPVRLGRQRGAERELHRRAGGVRRSGRTRAAAGELRRLGGRRARSLVGAAPALLAARPHQRSARDAPLRAADGAGRRQRLRAAGRRPLLPLPPLLPQLRRARTRWRSSSRRSCSSRCAAFSTRGLRSPTRSRATRRPPACTRW